MAPCHRVFVLLHICFNMLNWIVDFCLYMRFICIDCMWNPDKKIIIIKTIKYCLECTVVWSSFEFKTTLPHCRDSYIYTLFKKVCSCYWIVRMKHYITCTLSVSFGGMVSIKSTLNEFSAYPHLTIFICCNKIILLHTHSFMKCKHNSVSIVHLGWNNRFEIYTKTCLMDSHRTMSQM